MSARTASVFLCIILCGVAVTDILSRKVSNRWLLLGVPAGIMLNGPRFLLPAFLMFFPVYLLFRLGLMGAGDGKVIMLIAGSLGLVRGLKAIFPGLVAAALFSLLRIFREKSLYMRLWRLRDMAGQLILNGNVKPDERDMLINRENTIPFAAFIAAGTIIYIFVSEISIYGGLSV